MKGYVQVGLWKMCCERIVDPDETRGVPGEVWPRRKYSLDGEKALRFEDNMSQNDAEGNECDDPEATMRINERVKGDDVRVKANEPKE